MPSIQPLNYQAFHAPALDQSSPETNILELLQRTMQESYDSLLRRRYSEQNPSARFTDLLNNNSSGDHYGSWPGRLILNSSPVQAGNINISPNSLISNTGTITNPDGSFGYVPQGYYNPATNEFQEVGIIPTVSQNLKATSYEEMTRNHSQAIKELDLKIKRYDSNGNPVYKRDGYSGEYTLRNDGGIQYSGGSHVTGGYCPSQTYYAGSHMWHANTPDSSPPQRTETNNSLNTQPTENSYSNFNFSIMLMMTSRNSQ